MVYERWAAVIDCGTNEVIRVEVIKRGHLWDHYSINKIATAWNPGTRIGYGWTKREAIGRAMPTKKAKLRKMSLVKMCNCSVCGVELLGHDNSPEVINTFLTNWELVAARIRDRPVCRKCLPKAQAV